MTAVSLHQDWPICGEMRRLGPRGPELEMASKEVIIRKRLSIAAQQVNDTFPPPLHLASMRQCDRPASQLSNAQGFGLETPSLRVFCDEFDHVRPGTVVGRAHSSCSSRAPLLFEGVVSTVEKTEEALFFTV